MNPNQLGCVAQGNETVIVESLVGVIGGVIEHHERQRVPSGHNPESLGEALPGIRYAET